MHFDDWITECLHWSLSPILNTRFSKTIYDDYLTINSVSCVKASQLSLRAPDSGGRTSVHYCVMESVARAEQLQDTVADQELVLTQLQEQVE